MIRVDKARAARGFGFATLAITIAACAGGGPVPVSGPDPAGVPAEYVLRDSVAYTSSVYGGRLALLYRNDRFLDSVDVRFGIPSVPGGILFLPVRSEEEEGIGILTAFTRYVLFDGATRRELAEFLPAFDDHFSSPAVIESRLWYWGFREDSTGALEVHAMRHDFRSDSTQGTYLFRGPVATDDPYHFRPPERADDREVRFEAGRRAFWLDDGMNVVRAEER
jgi:hypothetical protein